MTLLHYTLIIIALFIAAGLLRQVFRKRARARPELTSEQIAVTSIELNGAKQTFGKGRAA